MKKIFLHASVWIVYTVVIALISTAFATSSDMAYPPFTRFMRLWLTEIGFLPLKIFATYFFLNYLIPKYFLKSKWVIGTIWLLLVVVICLVLFRLQLYYISFPLLYGGEHPNFYTLEPRRILYSSRDIIPPMALISVAHFLLQKIDADKREKKLLNEKLHSELRFLKSQTNPHFLFNTLNNIYALSRKNKPETSIAILKLSDILRYMLYECSQDYVSISSEIKIIKDYIELEKLRYTSRLTVKESYEIDNEHKMISPLLLLPLVENAFKHGVSNTRRKSMVDISLTLHNEILNFRVNNSADNEEMEKENSGIGMNNIRRQLELIYPHKHELSTVHENDHFSAHLKIQLN